MKIGICDDDEVQAKITEAAVRQALPLSDTDVEVFSSGVSLLNVLSAGSFRPDIVVMDVSMPELNGIDTAKRLNACLPACQIIFLTDYLNYATDVYEARHCYFVLKSQLAERMEAALHTAVSALQRRTVVGLHCGRDVVSVGMDEIIYLERVLRKTEVVCADTAFTTADKPEDILKNAGDGCCIVKCHQSFWVNLRHISALSAEECTVDNGRKLPVSRSQQRAVKEAFHRYLTTELSE